ncbi:MAG: response regulator [bacterium]
METQNTILLVDDDPAIIMTLGDRLELEGYKVIRASSGEAALAQLETTHPGLIILDIGMPGLGGLGFLKQISDDSGNIKYPVMVFTGRNGMESFFDHLSVAAFFPKTTYPEILIQKIKTLFRDRPTATAEKTSLSTPCKLMLVENDAEDRHHLARLFSQNGYDVQTCHDGNTVLETATISKPSVILLKYILPRHNGPDLATQLGAHQPTRHIPIVLYDDSGLHDNLISFPNVRMIIRNCTDKALLSAVASLTQPA